MGKSGKKSSRVDKKTLDNALYIYLANADPTHISLPGWFRNWNFCHGENRSSSGRTFHIAARQNSAGHYITCIMDSALGPIEGTEVDWGTREPSLSRVLRYYQAVYGVDDYPSSSSSSDAGNGGGHGGGGSGGSGGTSGSHLHGPYSDGYGGFFYNDKQGNYYPCDQSGKFLENGAAGYSQAAYFGRYTVCV